MAPKRRLKATPSNATDLVPFQKMLLDDLAALDAELLRRVTYQDTLSQEPNLPLPLLAIPSCLPSSAPPSRLR